jgi:phosphate-selective porin OprO/OprP
MLILALLAPLSTSRGGQVPDGASASSPLSRESELEERVRRLEELNRRLLEQDDAQRRQFEERYRDLERKYESLLKRLDAPAHESTEPAVTLAPWPAEITPLWPGPRPEWDFERAEPEAPRLNGFLKEGFTFQTEDEEYVLRLHVLDQTDFKVFVPNNQSPTRSGLYIPRVRFYFEGRLTRPIEYEVSLQRSVEGVWDLLDGNVNFRFLGEGLQLKFGRMLIPYSYDWYDHLEQYFITPERALFPLNLGLAREAALMGHGWLWDRRLQWAIAGVDGHLIGVADDNTVRSVVGYFNLKPFLQSERYPALRHLNLGASVTGGTEVAPRKSLPFRTSLQTSDNDEAAQSASARFLEFEEDVFSFGARYSGALHLAWYVGGLSLEVEGQAGRFNYIRGRDTTRQTQVPITGYHVSLGYFLTGETVEGRTTVDPLRPFDLRRGSFGLGAIEPFVRYSQLNLGRIVFDDELANPENWTNQAYMVDLGLNWYLSRYIKVYLDWQHTSFGSNVLLNPDQKIYGRNNDLFWIRCQLYY